MCGVYNYCGANEHGVARIWLRSSQRMSVAVWVRIVIKNMSNMKNPNGQAHMTACAVF